MTRSAMIVVGMAAMLAACGVPPMVSDTGYLGTWSRGNERSVSIVAITRVEDRGLFRWTKRS